MRREALAAELLLFIMDGAESELVGDEGGGWWCGQVWCWVFVATG